MNSSSNTTLDVPQAELEETTMAEKGLVEHGYIGEERDWTREMASGARLAMGNQDVAEPAPWGHRSCAGVELLQ
jgi:hypothetical protein